MMKLISVLAVVLLWTMPGLAETYGWVDDSGTYNFTEDYARVPKKYRNKVNMSGDVEAPSVPKAPVAPPSESRGGIPDATKDAPAGRSLSPNGTFGGKSYEQWRQEFGEREAAMAATKSRIDEIDGILSKIPPDKEQPRALISERNKAIGQFNEMRKQYDQLVYQARKAGIQVNITK